MCRANKGYEGLRKGLRRVTNPIKVNQNHYIYYGGALPPTPLIDIRT